MDCAATAKLLGAKDVKIVYRRTIEEMPASVEERKHIQESLKIPIFTGFKPAEIVGKSGIVAGFKAEGMYDESIIDLKADMIIIAIGQKSDDIKKIIDNELPDVFVAGDIVEKDKTVVQAVASGKLAAKEIDEFLAEKRGLQGGVK
jgi:dihydropyrimidine dehydrogenase (NAD+) subunit PreT